jgi:chromosomal replication initiation ATPase DnaA
MRKQFSDRQIKVPPEAIAYLLKRMERSFAGVRKLVSQLDEESLSEQRSLTVPFLKRILG